LNKIGGGLGSEIIAGFIEFCELTKLNDYKLKQSVKIATI